MPSTAHYSSYQMTKTADSDDDDLDALRKAALKTLNSKKRKVCLFFFKKEKYSIFIFVFIE